MLNPFNLACLKGQIEKAKQLYNKYINLDKIILEVCYSNQLIILQWLLTINYNLLDNIDKDELFVTLCYYNNIKILKYLLNNFEINFDYNNHEAIKSAIRDKQYKVIKLLCLKNENYFYIEKNNKIINYYIIEKININKDIIPDICCICYEKSNIITNCKHQYCLNCIHILYSKNMYKCCYCRQNITKLYNIKLP